MSENKQRPAALFIGIAFAILFLIIAIATLIVAREQRWGLERLIIFELALLSGLLLSFLFAKFFEAILLWIASMRAIRWLLRYDAQKSARTSEEVAESSLPLPEAVKDRHGARWGWPYRDRWILVAGDEPLVKRLAPGLTDTGYALTGNAVLLYAKQTGSTLDTAWLEQIRRLRRRRPVDAIVAVTRDRNSATLPFDTEELSQRLGRHARALRWAAPAYLLNVTDFGTEPSGSDEAIGFTWSNARTCADEISTSLQRLAYHLADAGVVRLAADRADRYPAELSQHIERLGSALSGLVTQTARSRYWRNPVHGLLFAPLFKDRELEPAANIEKSEGEENSPVAQQRSIWHTVAEHSRSIHGRRVGFSFSTTAAWIATAAIGLWIVGTTVSGFTNRTTVGNAQETLAKLTGTQDLTRSMQTLNSLVGQIDTLETRQRNGAPWMTRFGLNHDSALLSALWPGYENAAGRILVGPIRQKLEDRLHQLAAMSDEEIASGGTAQAQAAYDTLKAYLMLAQPQRAVASFLTPQLVATAVPARPLNSPLSSGTWEDLRQHTVTFFANHLGRRTAASGSALAIVPDSSLVASTRQTIIGVRGIPTAHACSTSIAWVTAIRMSSDSTRASPF